MRLGFRRAFTLSEILMALALLSLILVSAFGILHLALAGSQRQQNQTRAAFLAQQQLEQFLLQPELPLTAQGQCDPPDQGYAWSLKADPGEDLLMIVHLTVTGPRGSSFHLTSERRRLLPALVYRSQDSIYQTIEDRPEANLIASASGTGDFSLSGQNLVYVDQHKGRPQLFWRRLDSSLPAQMLFEHPQGASQPRFAPDGNSLAFTSWDNGVSQVFVYQFSSRSYVNRSRNHHQDSQPCWLPDGRSLVVCRDTSSIVQLMPQGNARTLVAESQGWNAAPDCDGSTLVFMSSRDGNPEIYALDLRSRKSRRLTEHPAYDTSPQIKGQRVLFQSNRDGFLRLYSMNLDGSEVVLLTPEQIAESPRWLP